MADESPLAGLLDRAGNVFSLAGKLGRAFHEEGQSRAIFYDPSIWQRHVPAFNEYCASLLDLREAMQNPPDGFASVSEKLLQAARIAKEIRNALARDGTFTAYTEVVPDLNTVCQAGWDAVIEETKARRLDDPFAFVDWLAIAPAYSLLERFPATPAGHIAFLEWVRDEVHQAAEAKRHQLERGYSNATIESMVRGINWGEARARLAALPSLPEGVGANIGDILNRALTVGTVEQIDALLQPVVWGLRDCFEQARFADLESKLVVVATAGDLWKAYTEGKRPCFESSGISQQPGVNTPTVSCADVAAEVRRTSLDRAQALVTAEGGDKAAAMEKLIARVQLQAGMDKASVVNMPLADFVAAAMGRGAANERRAEAVETFSQRSDLERLIALLEDEVKDRETSIPDELVSPDPLRGGDLYRAVQAVERHYGGKLPMGPWQAWRGMLLRADEEKGEDDPNERYERYYALCETLSQWATAERSRIAGTDANWPGLIAPPLAASTEAHAAAKPKRRGRKKADYETVQKEAALAADWERARDAGIYKADFAKDKNMTARQLDALLDRVAKRKRASE